MIKAVLIDAMFTIFQSRFHKNRYCQYRNFILKTLGIKIPIMAVRNVYLEKRQELYNKAYPNHRVKWIKINYAVFSSLLAGLSEEKISELAGRFTDIFLSPATLKVKRDTGLFLKQARERGFRLIIASNNEADRLAAMLEHFSLKKLVSSAYASSEIGFEKPDERFFISILEKEGLKPEECVMIGDNPENDVAAPQRLGIKAILYDPDGEKNSFAGLKVSKLTDIWKLDLFKSC